MLVLSSINNVSMSVGMATTIMLILVVNSSISISGSISRRSSSSGGLASAQVA
jgi:hypothetical protein